MISDFVTEWYYWLPLLGLVALAARLLGARLLDFQFLIILLLGQYAVHSVIAFGAISRIAIFCILFFALFVAFASHRGALAPHSPPLRKIDVRWMATARLYLLVYYSSRLILYPYLSGELLLDVRLAAQQENPVLFTLGLAVQPALAACMYGWLTSSRMTLIDKLTIGIVVVGMLGSGSKAAVLPLVLVYFGVASYLGRNWLRNRAALAMIAAAIGLTLYVLAAFFPDLEFSDVSALVQYRIAGNTDNLEYLSVIGLEPDRFPYAGPGALFPLLSKRFGYEFEFPPGVWLHGMRFGDWSGFGPNSGIVMDYYGNLGWLGLAAAPLLGWYVRSTRDHLNPIRCSFLSMAYIAIVDVGIFDVALVVWGMIWALVVVTRRVRGSGLTMPWRRPRRSARASTPPPLVGLPR